MSKEVKIEIGIVLVSLLIHVYRIYGCIKALKIYFTES